MLINVYNDNCLAFVGTLEKFISDNQNDEFVVAQCNKLNEGTVEFETFSGKWLIEECSTSEIINVIVEEASDDYLKRFLNITDEEIEQLFAEETLTDLTEKVNEAFQQMPGEELNAFLKELIY